MTYTSTVLADADAEAQAEIDFSAACERTIAGGTCTMCGQDAPQLLPWTRRERLCWDCADLQVDLLATAIRLAAVTA